MNIAQQIEFDQIKEQWMNLAVTAKAKKADQRDILLPVRAGTEKTTSGYNRRKAVNGKNGDTAPTVGG